MVTTTVVSFFHQQPVDVMAVGIVNTGADDPFLQPKVREDAHKGEDVKDRQGFGWYGRSLEDGVYEVEDSDVEVGPQHDTGEGDPVHREVPKHAEDDEPEEIEIEGVKYTPTTTLSKMRIGLKVCGLPKGRSKADAWKRLVEHHILPRTWQWSWHNVSLSDNELEKVEMMLDHNMCPGFQQKLRDRSMS